MVYFDLILAGVYVFGLVSFLILLFLPAPYGRFYREGFGLKVDGKLGWLIFETVPLLSFSYYFDWSTNGFLKYLLALLWLCHYINRSFIFTYRAPSMSPTTITTVLCAVGFNLANGYINATYIDTHQFTLNSNFLLGCGVFLLGMSININSDNILFELKRQKHKQRYSIPYGGFFKYISSPHYFGEIIEWTGWGIALYSAMNPRFLVAFAFPLFSISNLVPRAITTHAWYKKTFKDYPEERRAIIPFIL